MLRPFEYVSGVGATRSGGRYRHVGEEVGARDRDRDRDRIAVFAVGRVTDYSLLLFVLAAATGMLWSALVLGSLLPPAARLAVFGLVLMLIPATSYLQAQLGNGPTVNDLRRTGVPLLVPEIPGFELTSLWGNVHGKTVEMRFEPVAGDARDQGIFIGEMHMPPGFDPPHACGPGHPQVAWAGKPCVEVGADLWRRETHAFTRRYGDALYLVEGGELLEWEFVRDTAASLHPVTARQLARLHMRR